MTQQDRLLDLLASRATEGLSETEARELERLLAAQDEMSLDDFDEAAAAADLAFKASDDKMETIPTDLKKRILSDALSHLPAVMPDDLARALAKREAETGPLSARYLGWYVAAAMLALALWAPWATDPQTPGPAPVLTAAAQRDALIGEAADLIRVDWQLPEIEGYTQVRGDVVWSPLKQTGFMRLVGLPANQPTEQQYQLWIVDPGRDQHPIDGGVFDIAAGSGEVIVPIDAKLLVGEAAAFAITLEQSGGVVVSDGPLLVVAPVT